MIPRARRSTYWFALNTGVVGTTPTDRTGAYALLAGTVLATIALGGLGLRFARRRA
ncbi:MAG: hypothetical protein Q7K37_01105 [Dehalococcoidia bacterium]|nr:hypothetical protein [Dehalococcoidia bacterium]